MRVPTEAGWYYRKWSKGIRRDWTAGEAFLDGDTLTTSVPGAYIPVDTEGLEWGPRIPTPKQLEAIEELLRRDPFDRNEHAAAQSRCFFCDAPYAYATILADASDRHKPDCPWLRAQESDRE